MENEIFFQKVKESLNRCCEKETFGARRPIENTLKKYGIGIKIKDCSMLEYDENINYKKVFLNIYYDLGRLMQVPFDVYPDTHGEPELDLANAYFEQVLWELDIFEEFARHYISESDYYFLIEKYGLFPISSK